MDALTPLKVIVHTDEIHRRPNVQADRQTERQMDRQTGRRADRHKYRQAYRQPDRHTERRTDGRTDRQTDLFCLFWVLRYTKHGHSSKGKFFFQSYDYNTFSLHVLRMRWKSEKKNDIIQKTFPLIFFIFAWAC